jgi:hypothetical protein
MKYYSAPSYYTTKATDYYMTTHAAWIYYTTKATEYYMMTYAAHPTTPRLLSITLLSSTYCTYFPKYYSVFSCYTEAPAYYSTKTAEYYTEVAKYFSTPIYTSQSRLATQKLLFRATLK